MEKEKLTPGHLYHATFPYFDSTREYVLLFLNKDRVRKHFGIISSTEEISNDTLDIYDSYNTYTIKEIYLKDLPLFINWHQTPLFSKLLKGEAPIFTPSWKSQYTLAWSKIRP
jgi:hypothetical protein